MGNPDGLKGLEFACECVSSRGGYSDPWSAVAQRKMLPDGTKEEILNLVATAPRTVAQLAKALNLSAPSVHTHVGEMLASELLRESVEWEKRYPTERYYEPNFPVVRRAEREEFEEACREMSEHLAALFRRRRRRLEEVYARTGLGGRGWEFRDVAQYLYARVQREARLLLEEDGTLPPRQPRGNGAEWVFWAEEGEGKL